ncbi:UDP-3-O-(3-hydroxymyristoyl)glucosamine N-acyltransferase [Rickettsiales bacterium LUAb2]
MRKYFKQGRSFTLGEVKDLLNAEIIGEADLNKQIEDVSTLQSANSNQISFLSNHKYSHYLKDTKAYACIVSADFKADADITVPLIKVKDSYSAFAILLQNFYPTKPVEGFISPKANISSTAKIGNNCHISDGVFIGSNVEIGDNTFIGINTVIFDNCKIGSNCHISSLVSIKCTEMGNNCILHEGVRLGQDGFGFAPTPQGNIKIPQIGGVEIGDDVEIGANSCIDRGALENTKVKKGTKIDNLVQIGHNVEVGEHCFLASQSGISGSTKVGNRVAIAGQAGLAPHLNIGDFSQIGPKSGVSHDVAPRSIMIGAPARPFYEFWKLQALLTKLLKK